MHAYLLLGKNDCNNAIKNIVLDNDKTDFHLQKIDDVRELKSMTKFHSDKKIYFVLDEFQNATKEAMSAFLKLLEEPSENVNFILCASESSNILDTIISRCNVIRLGHSVNSKAVEFAASFIKSTPEKKLKKIHSISDRQEAISFLSLLIEGGHALLIKNKEQINNLSGVIESAMTSKDELEQNANVTLAMTKFALDLV